MKLKIYKQALLMLVAFVTLSIPAIAQKAGATPPEPPSADAAEIPEVIVPEISAVTAVEVPYVDLRELNVHLKKLDKQINKNLNKSLKKLDKQINGNINKQLKNLDKVLAKKLDNLEPLIASVVNDIAVDVNTIVVDTDAEAAQTPETNAGPQDERVKVYSKSYTADKDDVLEIDNQYGNITVNTWNKNEFKIEIKVSVSSSNAEEAQRILDNIKISDAKIGSTVSFKTQFNGVGAGNSWSLFKGKKTVRTSEIVYNVYMPAKNTLIINSKYSGITLPELRGKVIVRNTYGSLYAKSLKNTENDLNLKYCDINIDELSGASLNLSYGSLKLGKIGTIEANVNYAPVTIEQLLTSGEFNVKYGGGIKIADLATSLKNLNINSAYSNVDLLLNGKENFDFDVTVSYNTFKHDNNVKVTEQTPDNESQGFQPTKNYKGYVGKANTNAKVVIINKYQRVSIQ